MIDKTLHFIVDELNTYLDARFPTAEKAVVLSSLTMPDGALPPNVDNKIVVSLVNLERETARPYIGAPKSGAASAGLNVYFVVSACFGNNYSAALMLLSGALAFFETKPVFTSASSPALPLGLERLSVEQVNLDFQELHNLWGALGVKYLPSAVFKAHILAGKPEAGK
jgi:hypothetical protein